MLVFKPSQKFLLLPPKIFTTTTNSKPHLLHLHLHLHLHHHHHHDVKQLHCSPLKPHFKSTLSSSSPSDSSSLTITAAVVDFLMDSGGLSYQEALHLIREMPSLLKNGGRKPRLVIAYFESIGFTKTHISKTISRRPILLVADVEKTLKPKIQFFQDFGFSELNLADLIALQPILLHRSVKNQIKPALELMKRLVKTDEDLIKAIMNKNNALLLRSIHHRNYMEPNMDVFRHHGVPDSEILHLILTRPTTLMSTPKVFKSIVERIASLGFKPETRKFVYAVSTMSRMKKATWDSKIDLLKGLGWSDQQILDAFIGNPRYLTLSGEKIKESIEFFKENLNWDASVLSQRPIVLDYSLKGRIIPRFAVLKCLMSKEIIKENNRFKHMLKLSDTEFLSKYVFKYQDQLPYLYEVYQKECIMGGCEEDNGDREITNQQDHDDIDINLG